LRANTARQQKAPRCAVPALESAKHHPFIAIRRFARRSHFCESDRDIRVFPPYSLSTGITGQDNAPSARRETGLSAIVTKVSRLCSIFMQADETCPSD